MYLQISECSHVRHMHAHTYMSIDRGYSRLVTVLRGQDRLVTVLQRCWIRQFRWRHERALWREVWLRLGSYSRLVTVLRGQDRLVTVLQRCWIRSPLLFRRVLREDEVQGTVLSTVYYEFPLVTSNFCHSVEESELRYRIYGMQEGAKKKRKCCWPVYSQA